MKIHFVIQQLDKRCSISEFSQICGISTVDMALL